MRDKGPWEATTFGDHAFVCSDDFTHDVCLRVQGDFRNIEDALAYANEIAEVLNAAIKK